MAKSFLLTLSLDEDSKFEAHIPINTVHQQKTITESGTILLLLTKHHKHIPYQIQFIWAMKLKGKQTKKIVRNE